MYLINSNYDYVSLFLLVNITDLLSSCLVLSILNSLIRHALMLLFLLLRILSASSRKTIELKPEIPTSINNEVPLVHGIKIDTIEEN